MMNETVFANLDEGLTFDDLLVLPGYSEKLPSEMDLRARLAGDIYLNLPLMSAAMDTVTGARMAIAMAREGGIGIIHRNLTPEDQAKEVEIVKRSESGMISDPIVLPPTALIKDAEAIMARFHISGLPIIEPVSERLVGILTNRDLRFVNPEDMEKPVTEYMTSEGLVTAPIGTTLEKAKEILQKHRIEKLPLVDEHGHLKGLITVKDIQKRIQYPAASKDSQGRLLAGAAVGVGKDLSERVERMLERGVDILDIDTAHGHSLGVLKAIKLIKSIAPGLPLIAGNVVTAEGTDAMIDAGADAVKVGVGAGSICTTRVISGAGYPQMSAIYYCTQAAARRNIPVIADGGLKFSGDIVKAIAAGAETVMLGSLLAGLEEGPGELILYEGRQFKSYRGMGSVGAMEGFAKDRYASGQGDARKLVPEGIEGMVPYRGTLHEHIYQLVGGLRSGMGYAGVSNLEELRTKAKLVRITGAGLVESHPHDVTMTRDAPNYMRG
jgi:IMP dehydrogenase